MRRKALPGWPAAPPPQSAAASAAQLLTERQPPAAPSLPLLSPVAVHCNSSESRVLALVALFTEFRSVHLLLQTKRLMPPAVPKPKPTRL